MTIFAGASFHSTADLTINAAYAVGGICLFTLLLYFTVRAAVAAAIGDADRAREKRIRDASR